MGIRVGESGVTAAREGRREGGKGKMKHMDILASDL
jgi:hypothetical protein